jgi:pimeloyl-ACP methyl ester carboxylesterase
MQYFTFDRRFQRTNIARFRTEMICGLVRELPGAGHFLHYTRADEVERLMRRFLGNQLDTPASHCRVAAQ